MRLLLTFATIIVFTCVTFVTQMLLTCNLLLIAVTKYVKVGLENKNNVTVSDVTPSGTMSPELRHYWEMTTAMRANANAVNGLKSAKHDKNS